MIEIHKKIILVKVCEMLSSGTKTKTHLKRYAGFTEDEIEQSVNYGLSNNILIARPQGYIERSADSFVLLESDYYPCIESMLTKYYESIMPKDSRFLISKTARKDSKIAGRWTRPDFTVVSSRKFPYIFQTEFDIITFEIKRPADCEALAVFEALAHNSAATRSYVFFPITEEDLEKNPQGERIREECVRHGIGLFLVCNKYKLEEAVLVIDSQRRTLNPEKCSSFLQNVLESVELSRLTTWA